MSDLTANDFILIVAVLGFIAISGYTLFLENRLLSRVAGAEREFQNSQKEMKKFAMELDRLGTEFQQIRATEQALETGNKDLELMNLRITSFGGDLLRLTEKFEALEIGVAEMNRKIIMESEMPENLPSVTKKMEQPEPESYEAPQGEF